MLQQRALEQGSGYGSIWASQRRGRGTGIWHPIDGAALTAGVIGSWGPGYSRGVCLKKNWGGTRGARGYCVRVHNFAQTPLGRPDHDKQVLLELARSPLVVVVKARGLLEMGAPLARFPKRHAWDTIWVLSQPTLKADQTGRPQMGVVTQTRLVRFESRLKAKAMPCCDHGSMWRRTKHQEFGTSCVIL